MKYFFGILIIVLSFSCNNTENKTPSSPYGIGPIKKLELPTISDSLVKEGMTIFKNKCAKCHTMEYKNTGPDISDILAYRKPEWVMNFLLNNKEMLLKDSLAINTRKKYNTNCNAEITIEKEAFALLEYLRIYQIWLHEFNTKPI